ncbi:MAG: hypothetical protein EXR76_07685 [Myxococcales bacterium]|nr:hypothetical protein [Myxococcales bacterium]
MAVRLGNRWGRSFAVSRRGLTASLIFVLAGCQGSGIGAGDVGLAPALAPTPDAALPVDAAVPGCTPAREAWDTSVKPIVERHCGTCHGEQPLYGALYSLVDYDTLFLPAAGYRGQRVVDRITARTFSQTMPPPQYARPPYEDIDAIAFWASCGVVNAVPQDGLGLVASAPVWVAPAQATAGLPSFDVRAGGHAVAPDSIDEYVCFTVEAPTDADRFVRRIEAAVDRAEIVHHLVLLRDYEHTAPDGVWPCYSMPEGSDYLYAWAPGQDAVQFPEGGLRIRAGERFVLQIHYNNAQRLPDVVDVSGVRIYHDEPVGTEYGMVAIGPLSFQVRGHAETKATGNCDISEDSTLLAGMPHMHTLGESFEQKVVHADGTETPIISLTGWSFEDQLFYNTPTTLKPGDRIETSCVFDNPGETVKAGPRTQDEMCYNFAYVTPPPSSRYCDGGGEPVSGDVVYTPSECLLPGAIEAPNQVMATFHIGERAELTGGLLIDGTYEMTAIEVHLASAALTIGELDLASSYLNARGQMQIVGGEVASDVATHVHFQMAGGPAFDGDRVSTTRGRLLESPVPAVLSLLLSCPEERASELPYRANGETVTFETVSIDAGEPIYFQGTYTRRPDGP